MSLLKSIRANADGNGFVKKNRSKRPKNVAYIVHTFQMGGLERCVAHLVNHLDRSLFAPYIVCLNRNGDAMEWVKVNDVPVIELHKPSGNDLRVVHRLAAVFKDYQIDIVHSQNWCTLLESVLARRWAGVPCQVHGQQGLELEYFKREGLGGRLRTQAMRWGLSHTDAVVAVAEAVRYFLSRCCRFPRRRIHLVPNCIEMPNDEELHASRAQIRHRLGLGDDSILIGSVGRLVEVKDFRVPIDAMKRLVRAGYDIHLVLVGDGPERQRLAEHAVAEAVAERTHLVGQQTNVTDWLGAMDIFINSSFSEGMSLAILEGMAAGLPLTVTDVGANAILVNTEPACGLVVPPRNANAFAGALQQLIVQPELRGRFAKSARRHARQYSVQETVDIYQNLYSQLQK